VDTNVIVSLLVQDDPPHAKAVADWFEQQQDEVWLSIVVIREVVWVLVRQRGLLVGRDAAAAEFEEDAPAV